MPSSDFHNFSTQSLPASNKYGFSLGGLIEPRDSQVRNSGLLESSTISHTSLLTKSNRQLIVIEGSWLVVDDGRFFCSNIKPVPGSLLNGKVFFDGMLNMHGGSNTCGVNSVYGFIFVPEGIWNG
ncbi:hypothetical protein C0J52_02045 [Blattella germanica]|nr:hypothetical protein C0J52_02045 [Blattella germanica]